MSPSSSFELHRLIALPAGAELAVVELEGRLGRDTAVRPGATPRALKPRLLLEDDEGRMDIPAATWELDGRILHAAWAVPTGRLFEASLAVGLRDVLFDLPAPDTIPGAEREIALAREANGLRRELASARAELAAAAEEHEAAVAEVRQEEAERLAAAELLIAREREEAAERLAALQEELDAARRDADAREEAALAASAAREEELRREADTREEAARREGALAVGAARADAETRVADAEARLDAARREAEAREERARLEAEEREEVAREEAEEREEQLRREAEARLEQVRAQAEARIEQVRAEMREILDEARAGGQGAPAGGAAPGSVRAGDETLGLGDPAVGRAGAGDETLGLPPAGAAAPDDDTVALQEPGPRPRGPQAQPERIRRDQATADLEALRAQVGPTDPDPTPDLPTIRPSTPAGRGGPGGARGPRPGGLFDEPYDPAPDAATTVGPPGGSVADDADLHDEDDDATAPQPLRRVRRTGEPVPPRGQGAGPARSRAPARDGDPRPEADQASLVRWIVLAFVALAFLLVVLAIAAL